MTLRLQSFVPLSIFLSLQNLTLMPHFIAGPDESHRTQHSFVRYMQHRTVLRYLYAKHGLLCLAPPVRLLQGTLTAKRTSHANATGPASLPGCAHRGVSSRPEHGRVLLRILRARGESGRSVSVRAPTGRAGAELEHDDVQRVRGLAVQRVCGCAAGGERECEGAAVDL